MATIELMYRFNFDVGNLGKKQLNGSIWNSNSALTKMIIFEHIFIILNVNKLEYATESDRRSVTETKRNW